MVSIKENTTAIEIERNIMSWAENLTSLNESLISEALTGNYTSETEKKLLEAIAKEQATIQLYSFIMIASIVSAIIQTYAIFDYCRRASVNIHKSMVANIMSATMSFFDTHFIGNVLNRFSQDLNNIDEQLPFTMREFIRVWFCKNFEFLTKIQIFLFR